MNVFYLHEDPRQAARMHIWHKHVVKMILEYAQMLSTAHRILDESDDDRLYRITHINHPSNVWIRQHESHYAWVYQCMMELGRIYKQRTSKDHLTITKLGSLLCRPPRNITKNTEFNKPHFTPPPPAMPDEYKVEGNSLASYLNYYEHKKEIL